MRVATCSASVRGVLRNGGARAREDRGRGAVALGDRADRRGTPDRRRPDRHGERRHRGVVRAPWMLRPHRFTRSTRLKEVVPIWKKEFFSRCGLDRRPGVPRRRVRQTADGGGDARGRAATTPGEECVRPISRTPSSRLLEALSQHAASGSGREACLRSHRRPPRPSFARSWRVDELRAITRTAPPRSVTSHIRPALAVSGTPGARLSSELLEIAATLGTVRQMWSFTARARPTAAAVLPRRPNPLPELDRLLSSTLDDEGEVRDDREPHAAVAAS